MPPSPNPFADDPLPDGVVRLQSAVDPLDPYAAPPSADEYRPPLDPGVGLWRDGKYLVMHLDAEFPPRCLATNEPGTIRRNQSVNWCYPIDWSTRNLKIEYSISPAEQQRIGRARRLSLIIAGVSLLCFISLTGISSDYLEMIGFERWKGLMYCGLGAAILGGVAQAWRAGKHLEFVRARKSYLWFTGPKEPFLNSLPVWPGLK